MMPLTNKNKRIMSFIKCWYESFKMFLKPSQLPFFTWNNLPNSTHFHKPFQSLQNYVSGAKIVQTICPKCFIPTELSLQYGLWHCLWWIWLSTLGITSHLSIQQIALLTPQHKQAVKIVLTSKISYLTVKQERIRISVCPLLPIHRNSCSPYNQARRIP